MTIAKTSISLDELNVSQRTEKQGAGKFWAITTDVDNQTSQSKVERTARRALLLSALNAYQQVTTEVSPLIYSAFTEPGDTQTMKTNRLHSPMSITGQRKTCDFIVLYRHLIR